MKKQFYIIAGIALTGCIYFECSPTYSSEAVRAAEIYSDYADDPETEPYYITLYNDSIQVIDPTTGEAIYKEAGNAKSGLAEAIRKDNE